MSEKGSDKEGIQNKIIRDLEFENSELRRRLNIPRGEYIQPEELAQEERDKSALNDTIARERDENAKMVAELVALK